MNWFKENVGKTMILILACLFFWNMNEKMNKRFNKIDKELGIIKTFIVVKKVISEEHTKPYNEEYRNDYQLD